MLISQRFLQVLRNELVNILSDLGHLSIAIDSLANSFSNIFLLETRSKISTKIASLLYLMLDINWPWLKEKIASFDLDFECILKPGLQLCQNQGCNLRGHQRQRCEISLHWLPFQWRQSQCSSLPFYFSCRQLYLFIYIQIHQLNW